PPSAVLHHARLADGANTITSASPLMGFRRGWRIWPGVHHTALAPHHRILAKPALAFQGFGHRPFENLQDLGLVLVPLRHDRLRLCSSRIIPGCITSRCSPCCVNTISGVSPLLSEHTVRSTSDA